MPIFPLAQQPLQNQRGQGLIEYLIVVALIAVATIGVMRFVGQSVSSKFAEIGYALDGKKKTVAIDTLDDNLVKKRDLGDFLNGVGSGSSESAKGSGGRK